MTAIPHAEFMTSKRIATPLSLLLAWRDLRGGIAGFYVFIASIALGVAAIAAVKSLSQAFESGITAEGAALLGGDIDAGVVHRRASAEERAVLAAWGEVSEIATVRGMARREDGGRQTLVDVKAVDGAYPLYGGAKLAGGGELDGAIKDGGVVIGEALAAEFKLATGDRIILGDAHPRIAGIIEQEPDRPSFGPMFGPRVLMSAATLPQTGMDVPGSLIRWHYRVRLKPGADLAQARKDIAAKLAPAGFGIRDRGDPSPGIRRAVDRLNTFLTLAGLTALLTGGIGVANGVSAFVARKRQVIAVYKALGASSALVTASMLWQIMMLAGLGIVLGLAIGLLAPFLVVEFAGASLPVRLDTGFHPLAALTASLYGILTALIFVLWPLGRATEIRAAELLREKLHGGRSMPPRLFLAGCALGAGGLALLAIGFASDPLIALWVSLGLIAAFALFFGLGEAIRRGAKALPRPRWPEAALAFGNISRPGGLTRVMALSLGAGLTLLTANSLIGGSLTRELASELPEKAPSHFFLLNKASLSEFADVIAKAGPGSQLKTAPMLRGRIVELAGRPASAIKPPDKAAWVLEGDRGLTFSESPPERSRIVEGSWWEPGYSGPPLVSFDIELGKALGLKLGDPVTVNVLGRNLTASIANFRTVKWDTLGINFVMIFSPNALEQAPYQVLASLTWPSGHTAADEAAAVNAVAARFPDVTTVRVRDLLQSVAQVMTRVLTAARVAGGVTLLAGIVVLAGALAAAQQRRIYEAIILKTLGATRLRIIAAQLLEQLSIAAITGVFASALGALAAYMICVLLMKVPFTFSAVHLLQAAALTTIFVLTFGAVGTLRVLRAKAASYLRAE